MPVGRPFKPGNKLGRGRPKGSLNKMTGLAQELLESHSEAVLRKGLNLAEKGDSGLIRFFLNYILPARKELPITIGPLPMGDAAELSESSKMLMAKTTAGEISLSDASAISDLMETRRQIIKLDDHEMRLQAIEKHARESKPE